MFTNKQKYNLCYVKRLYSTISNLLNFSTPKSPGSKIQSNKERKIDGAFINLCNCQRSMSPRQTGVCQRLAPPWIQLSMLCHTTLVKIVECNHLLVFLISLPSSLGFMAVPPTNCVDIPYILEFCNLS